jgi:acetyl esterase/lipase
MATADQVDEVIAFLAEGAPGASAGLPALRRWVDGLGRGLAAPACVSSTPADFGGVRVVRYDPPNPRHGLALLYLHGGAFMAGSAASHGSLAATIAAQAGVHTVLPEYRLAPEHPFPAALDDARMVYLKLVQEGWRVSLAGDSAGGNLAVSLALDLRASGSAMPASLTLLSPWVDLTLGGASIREKADVDPMITAEALAAGAAAYAGPLSPNDPRLSPLFADLTGLPPLQVLVGGRERVLDDSRQLTARAKSAGVAVEFEEWSEMIHVWPLFGKWLPEGPAAVERIARHLLRHVS